MKCFCGTDMHRSEIEHLGRWGKDGPYVRVLHVPAWICDRGHDPVLDGAVAQIVADMVRAGKSGVFRTEELTVKDFRAVAN